MAGRSWPSLRHFSKTAGDARPAARLTGETRARVTRLGGLGGTTGGTRDDLTRAGSRESAPGFVRECRRLVNQVSGEHRHLEVDALGSPAQQVERFVRRARQ